MIISTKLIPRGFSAFCLWPFIFVRPEFRSDTALIEHELVHYREQAWITPVWVILYLVSRKFRLAAEVRAYTRQIEVGGVTREQAAHALMSYRLGISYGKAMQELA
ncbi:hypothetical protein [Polaromonas naphthalenivorans]|uniref:Peptidase M56 domain-containing protein n=1 Tax=Polaromonas naphthalenivorans (strain CJ2) TaxID=365044 RepID=A1VU91_POLNA|nr:hypothetical protein [Polaromonas naphthalenivorans]ABM39219.1 conserved hypothetical protein [Polaromonas naphthalenivorans CJ2]